MHTLRNVQRICVCLFFKSQLRASDLSTSFCSAQLYEMSKIPYRHWDGCTLIEIFLWTQGANNMSDQSSLNQNATPQRSGALQLRTKNLSSSTFFHSFWTERRIDWFGSNWLIRIVIDKDVAPRWRGGIRHSPLAARPSWPWWSTVLWRNSRTIMVSEHWLKISSAGTVVGTHAPVFDADFRYRGLIRKSLSW